MYMPYRVTLLILVLTVVGPHVAHAQQRPLATQDPEAIGANRVLLEGGVETGRNVNYPVSGLTGERVSIPIGVSFGLGPNAELQIDAGYQWLGNLTRVAAPLSAVVQPGPRTSDVIDAVVATKLKILSENAHRPAVGIWLATQLPNASNESGLGLDTMNFYATLLVGRTVRSTRVVGNAGIAVLSDVLQGTVQKDAFIGSVSVARALSPAWDVVGELTGQKVLSGHVAPVGSEPRGALRAAARYTHNAWRVDGGLVLGLTQRDPDVGVSLGMTWVGTVH
jgi:hypothetical protein